MKRLMIAAFILMILAIASGLAYLRLRSERASMDSVGIAGRQAGDALTPDPGWEAVPPIPPFTMTDQAGRDVDESIFEGRVTVLTFFFTHCPSVCPFMNGCMYELTERLADTPVRFASVSVDPEHDTPDVLRNYADNFGVPDDRWRFLSSDADTLDLIVRRTIGFDLSFKDNTIPTRDGEIRDIQHPGTLLLVGPDRRILGKYGYERESEVDALADRARRIAADQKP